MNQPSLTRVIVDDAADTVTVLRDFFAILDFVAIGCDYGPDAFACIKTHRPSAVILDVLLPGMTGVDVLHAMRADPAMRTVPVVFFPGSEDHLRQLLPDYAAHGATFVRKPHIEQLHAVVQRLVEDAPS